jgi:hypothetical protein
MSDKNEVPVTKKRAAKTPIEAARANADAAIVQLENLGGKLFRINKPELTEDLRGIITNLQGFREQL